MSRGPLFPAGVFRTAGYFAHNVALPSKCFVNAATNVSLGKAGGGVGDKQESQEVFSLPSRSEASESSNALLPHGIGGPVRPAAQD